MWQYSYDRATEIAAERTAEADRARLAAQVRRPAHPSLVTGLRRSGALAAASVARRLDECVAREALAPARGQPGRAG